MDQQHYQPRIQEPRERLRDVYRQASEAVPEAVQPESPYCRQGESLISKINAMHLEMGDWP